MGLQLHCCFNGCIIFPHLWCVGQAQCKVHILLIDFLQDARTCLLKLFHATKRLPQDQPLCEEFVIQHGVSGHCNQLFTSGLVRIGEGFQRHQVLVAILSLFRQEVGERQRLFILILLFLLVLVPCGQQLLPVFGECLVIFLCPLLHLCHDSVHMLLLQIPYDLTVLVAFSQELQQRHVF